MGAHGRMFARAKGKQQKKFWQLQCLEQCIDHIPYIFRDRRVHIFADNLSRNSRKRFDFCPKECWNF